MQLPLGLRSLGDLLEQQLIGLYSLGIIAGHFSKSDQLAGFVSDRRDDHIGPEARAIFAQPPSIILKTSYFGGDLQFAFWLPRSEVFLRIKNGKVFSDDLGNRISFDAFGPGIPTADVALHV